MNLSERLRPNIECAPWIIEDVQFMESELELTRQRVVELEELLSTREDDLGIERHWVKTTSEKLAASEKRVAELEAEVSVEEKRFSDQWELLAASQAHNLRLREVFEMYIGDGPYPEYDALSAQTDTEALEQYLADRLGEPVGYWFSDDPQVCAYPGSGYFPGIIPPNDAVNITPLYSLKEKP